MEPPLDRDALDALDALRTCLVRVQHRLLSGGYRYLAGQLDLWPLSPVLLTKEGGAILVSPLAGDTPAAFDEVLDRCRRARAGGLQQRGLIVVGTVDADDREVQRFLRDAPRPAAYLDAIGRRFRAVRRSGLFAACPGALRDEALADFLRPAGPDETRLEEDCHDHLADALAQMREAREFHERVSAGRRVGLISGTTGILAVCIGVFALMTASGVNITQPSIRALLNWGASYGPLIKDGQWWRLATNIFVHIGLVHLLFNMYATYVLGRPVEHLQGTWRMVAYFLFGGLVGSAASLWWTPTVVSAGASGGLFGIVGAMGAIYVRFWRTMPRLMRSGIRRWLLTLLVYNAVFLFLPFVDAAAHVGGLIGGFAMALALARSPTEPRRPGILALAAAGVLAVALAGFTVYAIARVPDQPPTAGRSARRRTKADVDGSIREINRLLRQELSRRRDPNWPFTQPTQPTQPTSRPAPTQP